MAAAATLSFSLTLSSDPQPQHRLPFIVSSPNPKYPFFPPHKSSRFNFKSSSSHLSSSTTATTETTSASATYSYLEDSFNTGKFFSNEELEKFKILQNFTYYQELETGSMWVRVMRSEEMDITVKLLAESFAESMLLPVGYVSLLRFLVKQYLIERRAMMPHAVTLIGFYRGKEEGNGDGEVEEEFAGTVEVCFDKRGANASPPTPIPPNNSPYICNMTVKEPLRRKALKTTLKTVIERRGTNGNGINVIVTTFSPSHFEGDWDKFGAYPKTKPYEEGEKLLEGMDAEIRQIEIEEVEVAKLNAMQFDKLRLQALDVTKLSLLRPDGHPGPYMYPFPFANGVTERVQNDCVHWCLPGPIDAWNEILLEVIKRWEYQSIREE